MTPEANKSTNTADKMKSTNTADKMKSVKAAWDKAPAGPKKDAALKHYQQAEQSHTAKNDAQTHKSLDAATQAMA